MIDFLPPERNPKVDELREQMHGVLATTGEACDRLCDTMEAHWLYNDKAAEAKKLCAELAACALEVKELDKELRLIGISPDLPTMLKRSEDFERKVSALLERFRAILVKIGELTKRDMPHPSSVMGRPIPRSRSERLLPYGRPLGLETVDEEAPFLK